MKKMGYFLSKTSVLCLASGCAILSLSSYAQETNPLLGLSLEQLSGVNSRVESASQVVQDIKALPQPVTVLSATDIRAFGYRTLAEILNSLPGLHTSTDHTYTFVGARGMMAMGGFNARVLVTIDGMQINDNIYQQVGLAGDEFPLDVDLIDRVEFIPGPGSVVYGNNAFLGVVNVVTRSTAAKEYGDLAVSIDHNGEFVRRGTAHTALLGGNALVSLTRYDHPGVNGRYDAYYNQSGQFVPSATADHTTNSADNQRLFVKYERGALQANLINSDRIKHVSSAIDGAMFNSPLNQFRDRWLVGNVQYRLLDSNDWTVISRVYAGNYRFNGRYGYEDATLGDEASEGRWWGIDLKGSWRGIQGHELSAGIQLQNNSRQWLYAAVTDPVTQSTTQAIDKARGSQSLALWLEDQFTLNASTKLTIGGRVDQDMQESIHLSPRLGVVHRLSEQSTLRANLARAFLTPSDYELRYANDDPALDFQKPNPLLQAESMTSLDFGWEYRTTAVGRLVLSSFLYEADKLIEFTVPEGQPLQQYNNVGGVTGQGVQLEWQRNWDSGWRLNTSLTLQKVQDKLTPYRIDSPEQLIKWQVRTPKVLGIQPALEGSYIGERATRDQQFLPSVNLLNASFTYSVDRHHTLRLSVYNLTDVDYQVPVSYDYAMPTVRQYGRTIRLKWEWSY
jgi:outer membrane receptor protein involved in Fe transport